MTDPAVFDRFTKVCAGRLDSIKRGLTFSLWGKVVIATPVDFGVARAGWHAQKDEPDLRAPKRPAAREERLPPPPPPTISPSDSPNTVYWVSNNVNYILFLKHGSSTQAPDGWVESAMAAVEAGFESLVQGVVAADGGL